MTSLANADFGSSDSEGEDFNPAHHVDSDDEDVRAPSRDNRKQPSKGHETRKSSEADGADEAEDDEDDQELKNGQGRGEEGEDGDGEKEDEDEEEHDDDDDDEEEDEDDRPRKRRKRPNHMQFIDEEAEVDDEDEEEEPEEDEVDETHPDDIADLPAGAEHDDYRHRQLDRERERLEEVDIEKAARRLRDKYGRQKVTIAEQSGVPQHLLLPSATDPSIWGVKCKPGKEYEVVNMIMKRFAERLATPGAIHICSAFARPSAMSGYVYIEARKQAEVTKATESMTNAYATQMSLIPQNEMPDLLRVRKPKEIKVGAFVRMKRPLKYAGDLAQVDMVEENQSEVTVRLVPRINYAQDETGQNSKRKRPGMTTSKPPAKLFNETEARKIGGRYLAGRGKNMFTFQNEDYENGFLIKAVKFAAVETDNVNPSLEEASKFATTADNEDGTQTHEIDLNAIAASLKESGGDYLPDDAVEIFSGEQQGVGGKVVSILGDVVTIRVAQGPLKGQRIEAPSKTIRKLFDVGDSVKVLQNSKYRGEVGTVLKVKDDKVTLLTDSNKQEITVLSRDLRVALDSSTPMLASKYSLFDLVQLDAATVGCIVRVDPETVVVLDQNGTARTMLPSSISGKIETRRPTVATDRVGSEIRKEDLVQENGGAQRKGVVMHIHRNFLFLEDKMVVENNGIFVVKSSTVNVISAKGARQAEGPNLSDMNPALMKNQQGTFGMMAPPGRPNGAGGPGNRNMPFRNRIDGQQVMIAKGPQKGLIGRVKDSTDLNARIEFMNKPGVHMFKVDMLKVKQRNGEWQRLDGTPTNKTPAPRVPGGARVPAGAMSGSRSAWGEVGNGGINGSQTPFWKSGMDGSRTPAFAGSRTPWDGGRDGSRTVNPYNDGSRTAYGDWNSGSRTPAPYASAPTPGAYGNSAPTPGPTDAPTPGGYLGVTPGPIDAPTPRVPYQYGTPAASAPTPGAFADTPGPFNPETPAAFGDDDDEPRYG